MTNQVPEEKQLTIAQYLVEVIDNKVIYKPNDKYGLYIDPEELDLIKSDITKEHDFYMYVIQTYIQSLQDKIQEFNDIPETDWQYKRQVNRTLKRLIYALKKHSKKSELSINWVLNFHMPVYGIDVYRDQLKHKRLEQKDENKTKQEKRPKPENNKNRTAKDLICLAYELDPKKTCHQKAFFDLASFQEWCETKAIKGKDIRLQTVKEAKLINDCVVNSDNAIEYLKNINKNILNEDVSNILSKINKMTVNQYIGLITVNREIHDPSQVFTLLIKPTEVNLSQRKNEKDHKFNIRVLNKYIEQIDSILWRLGTQPPKDQEYKIQTTRTLKRLISLIEKKINNSINTYSWEMQFNTRKYGIDTMKKSIPLI